MADELDRLSLTLPRSMIDRLDGIVEDWEYASRSEAIRDALRDFFTSYAWETDDASRHHGTVVIIYEHHSHGITETLQEIQHDRADIITAVQHVHLSHDRCIESLIVDGPGRDISDLANRLRSVGGVKQVKTIVVDE